MSLQVEYIKTEVVTEQIKFDNISDDMIILSIELNQSGFELLPNYYCIRHNRAGSCSPLEIGINTTDYSIQSITAYIDMESLGELNSFKTNVCKGTVILKNIFQNHRYEFINDNDMEYTVEIRNKMVIFVFGKIEETVKEVTNDRLSILVNKDNLIVGFIVREINKKDFYKTHNYKKESLLEEKFFK